MKRHSEQSGYITLMAVIVVGAAVSVIAVSMLLSGQSWSRSSADAEGLVQAKHLADSCIESGLGQIWSNTSYTGTVNLTVSVATPSGTCSYTVSGTAPNKTITSVGTSGSYVRRVTAVTSQTSPTIIISSWQDQ